MGLGLHQLQINISLRAAHLLKVGGLMVYSTCSFNPIENEAVVAELLRRSEGSLELMETADLLPGLIRMPGLETWEVFYKNRAFTRQEIENPASTDPLDLRKQKIKINHFPPTEEELKTMNLTRCMRFLPHHQNTGGFFVSLLRKTKEMPGVNAARAAADEAEAETKAEAEAQASSAPAPTDEKVVVEEKEAPTAVMAETTPTAEASTSEASTSVVLRNRSGQSHGGFQEDPFEALDPANVASIASFFGADLEFVGSHCLSRSAHNKRVYFLSPAVKEVLLHPRNHRLKVVQTGQRMFEKHRGPKAYEVKCEYRLVQEAVYALLPFITKQKVEVKLPLFHRFLGAPSIAFRDMTEAEAAIFQSQDIGSAVMLLEDREVLADESGALALACWITNHAVNVMASKPSIAVLKVALEPYTASLPAPPAPLPRPAEEAAPATTPATATTTTEPAEEAAPATAPATATITTET